MGDCNALNTEALARRHDRNRLGTTIRAWPTTEDALATSKRAGAEPKDGSMFVMLSQAACQHIAYLCNERSWRDTGLLAQAEAEELRMQFVKAALGDTDPMMFTLTRPQVRALDMLLTDADPRDGKLPDGSRVLELVESVWRTLIGDDDARNPDHDAHANSHSGADAGATISRS